MPSNLLTPDIIARESLMILKNNTVIASSVFRGDNADFNAGYQVGDTITIRKPATFDVKSFKTAIETQTVNEQSVALKLEEHFDISVELTTKELTLDLSSFSTQVIAPAMVNMAEAIDSYLYSKYTQIPTVVDAKGSEDSAPALTSTKDLAEIDRVLMVNKVPNGGRVGFLNPLTKSRFLGIENLTRLDTRGEAGLAGLRDAALGRVMNIDWYGAQAVPFHTPGAPGGAAVATGAAGAESVTITEGGASGTFKNGDIVSFAGVPGTFAVQADVTLQAGTGTLQISPALPVAINAAAVTVKAAHAANIVGNPRGLSFVSVPLALPMDTAGSAMAAALNWNGLSIRVVRGYDIVSKKNIISFDTLVGAKVTDPRLLVRFNG